MMRAASGRCLSEPHSNQLRHFTSPANRIASTCAH
jgi:hypothetical protein